MSTISSARWVALSQGGRVAIQLAGLVILARLLPATDYGLMAMATVVTNFALLLRDLGTAAAIIQKTELREETKATVFWLNVMMGLLLSLALFVSAPLIAHYFADAELVPVLSMLCIALPLASSGAVHQALLERQSAFRGLTCIEIGSSLAGLLAAIVAALSGAGVYSFVIQSILTAGLSSILLWIVSGWRPWTLPSWRELHGLIGFSGNLTLFNFINYFSRNADGMIIGRYLGAAALGSYSLAYKLMWFPVQNVTLAASRALYPALSRQQNAPEVMARLYLRTVSLIALVTAPLMVGLLVVREPFVRVVFGPGWPMVPEILAWLAPTGFIQSIVSSTGTVFMARGRTHVMAGLGTFNAIVTITAFALGAKFGVVGVAAFYFAANVLHAIPCLFFAMRALESSPKLLLKAIAVPVASALLMGLGVAVLRELLASLHMGDPAGLAMSIVAGVLMYGFLVVMVFRLDLADLRMFMAPAH